MSSGWFDCAEPSLSSSLQGKQGVQGMEYFLQDVRQDLLEDRWELFPEDSWVEVDVSVMW